MQALDLENDDLFRAANGLSDGIGLTGDGQCGAVSGAVMVFGYLYGRRKADFSDRRKSLRSSILAKKLHDWFVEKYGSCRCADVQVKVIGRSFNMWEQADYEEMQKINFRSYSAEVVADIARKAVEIILDERLREAEKAKS
jgi:C_GCAxxG_C_C family probable redox protein